MENRVVTVPEKLSCVVRRRKSRELLLRMAGILAMVAAVLATTVACGSSSGSGGNGASSGASASSAGGSSTKITKLTYVVGGPDVSYAPMYYALAKGMFAKKNLDVSIKDVGAETMTEIASGSADLAGVGFGQAMLPAVQGKDTSIIFGGDANGIAGNIIATKGTPSYTDCTKVVTLSAGTNPYAWAEALKSALRANWTITGTSEIPTALAALEGGHANCYVGSVSTVGNRIATGELHVVLNGSKPPAQLAPLFAGVQEGAIAGLASNLANKKAAIERFLSVVEAALKAIRTVPAQDVATALHGFPDFSSTPVATLASQLREALPHISPAPSNGYISSSIYATSVRFLKHAGSTYSFLNSGDAKWDYSQRVDMSYYDAAIGRPVGQK
jgi:ABC-type nitrate/sulfonate/bicarbonate transport system substrate-binding protein